MELFCGAKRRPSVLAHPKRFTSAACPLPQHGLAAHLAREWPAIIVNSLSPRGSARLRGTEKSPSRLELREVVAGVLRRRQFVNPSSFIHLFPTLLSRRWTLP